MLSLDAGKRVLACLSLMCQALLTPLGRPYPLGVVDGGWAWVRGEKEWEERWEGEMLLECQMNKNK